MNNLERVVVYENNPSHPTIIYVELQYRWGQAEVDAARKHIAALIVNLPHKVKVIIHLKNYLGLPPNSVRMLVELAADLQPAIAHVVFVGAGPLLAAALAMIQDIQPEPTDYVNQAATLDAAHDVLQIIAQNQSLPNRVTSDRN